MPWGGGRRGTRLTEGLADPGLRIVPALAGHIPALAPRVRAIDAAECRAMGRSAAGALRHGLVASAWCWTALVDGQPEAMFGLVVESVVPSVGVPWFLGSDAVWRHGRALVTIGPQVLATMHDSSALLANLVSADNFRAIRLLRRWGFAIAPEVITVGGMGFHRFASHRNQQENA